MGLISAYICLTIPFQDSNCQLEVRDTLLLARITSQHEDQPCSSHEIYVTQESDHTFKL